MGVPQSPNPPHLYPQALQLKLYQAFIFSIPILFSIILFLLFYLFYLKRRASNTLSSSPLPRPRIRSHQTATYNLSTNYQLELKLEIKDELPIVLFDEELRKKDSQCCVCLGDFVMKEELLQVSSCKHIFHIDCIHLWLHTNTSCPLCRCSVLPNTNPPKLSGHHSPPPPLQTQQIASSESQQLEEDQAINTTNTNILPSFSREQGMPTTIAIEGMPNIENSNNDSLSHNRDNENVGRYPGQGSVIINIQTHGTT